MPRRPVDPPLPDSPGAWLACFRHVRTHEGRDPLTPEQVGKLAGVSGATVRRWEANLHAPCSDEIERLAALLALTPHQTAFLHIAMSRVAPARPPSRADLIGCFSPVLRAPRPVIVFDSLFFARAWNSYVEALSPGSARGLESGRHSLALLLDAIEAAPGAFEEREVQNAVRTFWARTASLAYRPEYADLVRRLARNAAFPPLWLSLASEPDCAPLGPARLPTARGDANRFRGYEATVILPAAYHVFEYLPDTPEAGARLAALVAAGPPRLCFSPRPHWLAPEPEAVPAPVPFAPTT